MFPHVFSKSPYCGKKLSHPRELNLTDCCPCFQFLHLCPPHAQKTPSSVCPPYFSCVAIGFTRESFTDVSRCALFMLFSMMERGSRVQPICETVDHDTQSVRDPACGHYGQSQFYQCIIMCRTHRTFPALLHVFLSLL